jgi:hypothetical protein
MKKVIISLFAFASLAFSAINVAVINTEIDPAAPGLQKELNSAELRYITQEIRRQARSNLSQDYNVMTELAIMAQGDAVLQECADENCVVAFGEKIGADYIVKGTISKFRNSFVLSIEVYETRRGMLVASSDPIENADVAQFIPEMRRITPALFKKLADSSPRAAARKREKEEQKAQERAKTRYGIYGGFGDGGGIGAVARYFPFNDKSVAVAVEPAFELIFNCDDDGYECERFVIPVVARKYFLWNYFYVGAGPQIYFDFEDGLGIGGRLSAALEAWSWGLAPNITFGKQSYVFFSLYKYF